MTLHGLPDFQAAVSLPDGMVWRAFEATSWLAPPAEVRLAETDGVPAFRLSLTRPAAPFLPPPPYAALELTLAATRDAAAALVGLRELHPGAVLAPVYPAAGSARLEPAPGAPELPGEIGAAIEAIWSGLGAARFATRLGIEAASLLAAMVEDGTLPLLARLALGFDGVSPRLPVEVRFDPAALMAALAPLIPDDLTVTALAAILERAEALPLERAGAVPAGSEPAFAAALADRIAARFGSFAPAAGVEPVLRLPPAGSVGAGRFAWDLAVAAPARRWLGLRFDPFAAVRDLVAAEGAGRLVTRSVATPVPTGRHSIRAYANLPRDRIGLEALGVTVRADPAPPHRPAAAIASAMIAGTDDTAELGLQLAPGEPLAYAARGFAVIADALGVRRLDGAQRACAGPVLRLVPEDFAIFPLTLQAAPDLLAEAWLEGEVRYRHDGQDHVLGFVLDRDRPVRALGLPSGAEAGVLHLLARGPAGATLPLGPLPARHMRIELASFAAFGPQVVTVRCPPPPGVALVALDLVPDDRPDAEAETLAFTAAEPERRWRYFARSPFRGGYRWRIREPGPPATWRRQSSAVAPLEPMVAAPTDG